LKTKFSIFNEAYDEDNYYYLIKEKKLIIADVGCYSKSDRTFDIRFNDLAINKRLQEVLFTYFEGDYLFFAKKLSHFDNKKSVKLATKNPMLRILVQDPDLFVDVLEIFSPDDIRVIAKKYNI